MRSICRLALASALLLASFTPAAARPAQTTRKEEIAALKGLRAVFAGEISVTDQSGNNSAAPDPDDLSALFAAKLKDGGIRLVHPETLAAGSKALETPHVTVNVTVTLLPPLNGLYGYSIRVEAYEDATVVRNDRLIPATVWERASMGVVEKKGLSDAVTEGVESAVSDFVKIYRAANGE